MEVESWVEAILHHRVEMRPVETHIEPRLQELAGIKAVVFDIYGTLVISGSGDVGSADTVGRDSFVRQTLVEAGLLGKLVSVPNADSLQQKIQQLNRERCDSSCPKPEVDIVEVWRQVLAEHGWLASPPEIEMVVKLATRYEETEAKARIAIKKGYFDSVSSISKGLKALGDLDDGFKIAAIITEKAESIAKVIIKTKDTNTVIRAAGRMRSMLGDPTAEAKARIRVTKNNISAGVNIAGIVAAAAGGINAIKSKSSIGASLGGGGDAGDAGEVQAPDFNVVGAGGVSQLATTLAGVTGQPLKAFVVSKEITSAQELERNITNTASVG